MSRQKSIFTKRCLFGCDPLVVYLASIHRFPNPDKHPELFQSWVSAAGKYLKETDPHKIFQNKRICDHHFRPDWKVAGGRLMYSSAPTLNLCAVRQSLVTIVRADHSYCQFLYYTEEIDKSDATVECDIEKEADVGSYKMAVSENVIEHETITSEPDEQDKQFLFDFARHNEIINSEVTRQHKVITLEGTIEHKNISDDFCEVATTENLGEYESSDVVKQYGKNIHLNTGQDNKTKPVLEFEEEVSSLAELDTATYATSCSSNEPYQSPNRNEFEIDKSAEYQPQKSKWQKIRKEKRLLNEICRLRKQNKELKLRLRKMKNSAKQRNIDELLKQMPEPARLFTRMQYQESRKKSQGHRFTDEEKMLALSLFTQSRQGYKIMKTYFTLPSEKLLRRLLINIKSALDSQGIIL